MRRVLGDVVNSATRMCACERKGSGCPRLTGQAEGVRVSANADVHAAAHGRASAGCFVTLSMRSTRAMGRRGINGWAFNVRWAPGQGLSTRQPGAHTSRPLRRGEARPASASIPPVSAWRRRGGSAHERANQTLQSPQCEYEYERRLGPLLTSSILGNNGRFARFKEGRLSF